MSFTRTSSGLSNQNYFYDVDAIVFTEGGDTSWSIEEIKNNEFNENSVDILFWKKLFQKFKSKLNLKFKAVGSKNTVKAIALEIKTNNLTTVIAAMDSEFDQFHNQCINHPNVLYTHGYSWENDVWNQNVIISLLENVSGDDIDNQIIEDSIESFKEEIMDAVFADAKLFGLNDSFLPRKGHMKCVSCNSNHSPKIAKEILEELFNKKGLNRKNIHDYGITNNLEIYRNCYGHLLNDFIYHLVRFYSITILKIKAIHKDLMERYAINNFTTYCSTTIYDFHKAKIKNTLPI